MSIYVKTAQDIYDLAQDLLDGDEFQSDDAAQRSLNQKYNQILAERDWYFLYKTAQLPYNNLLLSQITDLSKVIAIRLVDSAGNVEPEPLRKAPQYDRYNTDYDYWIDEVNGTIIMLNTLSSGALQVDYKYKPNPLGFSAVAYSAGPPVIEAVDDTPVIPLTFRPLLALAMVLDFKKADEAQEMFREHGFNLEELTNAMIDDDNNHKEFYA